MKRHFCTLTLLAVALVPDWASACWRYGPSGYYATPVYYHPVPLYYCQPVIVPCTPVMPPSMHPPQMPTPPRGNTNIPRSMPPTAGLEPVRPAGGRNSDAPYVPMSGSLPPRPTKPQPDPTAIPAPAIPVSMPDPDPPAVPRLTFPKPEEPLPPLVLPKDDAHKNLPVVRPKGDDTKPPLIAAPPSPETAIPTPAPAPPDSLPIPGITPKGADTLPPLTLPPDVPVAPDTQLPKPPTIARSSPLSGVQKLTVNVYPASGFRPTGGTFKVGFYNHTTRALELTIDGQTVILPARSYLHAQLPARFVWKYDDRPATTATIPPDAAGLDVLFKE